MSSRGSRKKRYKSGVKCEPRLFVISRLWCEPTHWITDRLIYSPLQVPRHTSAPCLSVDFKAPGYWLIMLNVAREPGKSVD
jgi:hypothetical protein